MKQPMPMELSCPQCRKEHVDKDEWATRPHRKHLCEFCGNMWIPFSYYTVGIPHHDRTDPAVGIVEGKTIKQWWDDAPYGAFSQALQRNSLSPPPMKKKVKNDD